MRERRALKASIKRYKSIAFFGFAIISYGVGCSAQVLWCNIEEFEEVLLEQQKSKKNNNIESNKEEIIMIVLKPLLWFKRKTASYLARRKDVFDFSSICSKIL